MSWPKRFMWLEYILYIWYLWHWGWQTPNTRPINTNWVKYTRLDVSTAVQYQLSARLVNWLNLTLGYIYYHTATYCVLSRGAIYDSSSLTRRLDIGYRGGSIWKQFLTPLHWTLLNKKIRISVVDLFLFEFLISQEETFLKENCKDLRPSLHYQYCNWEVRETIAGWKDLQVGIKDLFFSAFILHLTTHLSWFLHSSPSIFCKLTQRMLLEFYMRGIGAGQAYLMQHLMHYVTTGIMAQFKLIYSCC